MGLRLSNLMVRFPPQMRRCRRLVNEPIADVCSLPDKHMMERDKDRWSPSDWSSSQRRGETLADDLQLLFGDLCSHWGICGAVADHILEEDETLTADLFASRVLIAEGWPPEELPYDWRDRLIKMFTNRYGGSVSASKYDQLS